MKLYSYKVLAAIVFSFMLCLPQVISAKVPAGEAAALKTTLTPFGAERAGNADGTIPAWDGGIKAPPAGLGYKGPGDFHPDPYAQDKILFSISAENLAKYADKLTEGQKELLKKFAKTYKLNVYPTRRSHAAPEWVYDNTFKNATECGLTEDGFGLTGNGYGGIPFPIPKRAEEVVFNHNMRWQGEGTIGRYDGGLVQPDGTFTSGGGGNKWEMFPWHLKSGPVPALAGDYFYLLIEYLTPSSRAGELLLVKDPINQSLEARNAWQYLPGQRRVRRAPTVAYDTPNPGFSGQVTYDETWLFNGALNRYNWKLLGKKEMFILYNCYKTDLAPSVKEIFMPGHVNPDWYRWELHRVWVVEATLKEGSRHVYAKRVMFFDEDSWALSQVDMYDGKGNLWRHSMAAMKNVYEVPATEQRTFYHFDFNASTYGANNITNGLKENMKHERTDENLFTPEELRNLGKR
jgi:hypothetical protein